jgi:hypothetical protein
MSRESMVAPNVEFAVCNTSAAACTSTTSAVPPTSSTRFKTAVSVTLTVTEGTSAALNPGFENFTL